MLLQVVAQHDEFLCAAQKQPVLSTDDLQAKLSDALLDKESVLL